MSRKDRRANLQPKPQTQPDTFNGAAVPSATSSPASPKQLELVVGDFYYINLPAGARHREIGELVGLGTIEKSGVAYADIKFSPSWSGGQPKVERFAQTALSERMPEPNRVVPRSSRVARRSRSWSWDF